MSNTAQRTPSEIADALRTYCHCDEFNGPRPWCAVDEAIAALRKPPQQVTPESITITGARFSCRIHGDTGEEMCGCWNALSAQRGGSE